MKAMVVDDSKAMRLIVGRTLEQKGVEVTQASNGKEALALLEAGATVDLMMIDFNMPVMDGLELVRAVRANASFANVKLVMVTSQTEAARVADALESGADEYIMKPFTPEVVHQKLELLGIL